jgi:hypothetical protein
LINKVSSRVLSQFADQLMNRISGGNLLNIFNTIASVGFMYTLLAPYFVGYSQHAKQRQLNRLLLQRLEKESELTGDELNYINTVVFSDSYKRLKDAVFNLRNNGHGRHQHLKKNHRDNL